jgi:DNA helicase HerA-like ATPase
VQDGEKSAHFPVSAATIAAGSSSFRVLFAFLERGKTVFEVDRLNCPTFDLDHGSDGGRFVRG